MVNQGTGSRLPSTFFSLESLSVARICALVPHHCICERKLARVWETCLSWFKAHSTELQLILTPVLIGLRTLGGYRPDTRRGGVLYPFWTISIRCCSLPLIPCSHIQKPQSLHSSYGLSTRPTPSPREIFSYCKGGGQMPTAQPNDQRQAVPSLTDSHPPQTEK